MIAVPIADIERSVSAAAADAGKAIRCSREETDRGQTLRVEPRSGAGVAVLLTVLEPGTLYLELSTGRRAEWIVRDESDLTAALDELQAMAGALFNGRLSRRGTLIAKDGRHFRLAGPSSPLQLISGWRHDVEAYPDAR